MTGGGVSKLQKPVLVLAILGTINLVNQMDRVLFSLMVEPIKAELEFSDSQMGLLGGIAFAVSYAVIGLVAGRIADNWNRVRLIGLALVIWSAATGAMGFAYSFLQMFLGRAAVGVGEAGCVPASQSIISDTVPVKDRAMMISLFTGFGTVGTLVGLLLGGLVLAQIGWRMTFVAFGLFGVIPVAVLFLFLRDPRPERRFVASEALSFSDVRTMLKRRETQALIIAIPLLYTLVGAATWIPAFFQRTHGISTEEFARVGGAFLGLGLIAGTFGGGLIINFLVRRDARWEFWWSGLSCALALAPLLPIYLGADLAIAYPCLFAAFFISATGFGPSMACMHRVANQSVRATAIAVIMFASSIIAYGGVPAVIGVLSDLFAQAGVSADDGASLRYAMLLTMLLPPLASVMFFRYADVAKSDDASDGDMVVSG